MLDLKDLKQDKDNRAIQLHLKRNHWTISEIHLIVLLPNVGHKLARLSWQKGKDEDCKEEKMSSMQMQQANNISKVHYHHIH